MGQTEDKASYIGFRNGAVSEDFRPPYVLRVTPGRATARELAAHHWLVWATGNDWDSPVKRLDL